jgi:hypothetical protein
MTNQQVFNKVIRHLRRQGKAAVVDGVCAYRASDGSKCAVGCLIPDELYHPYMEGVQADKEEMPKFLRLLGVDVRLAKRLQCLHDRVLYLAESCNDEFEFAVECLAAEFSLKVPEEKM